MEYSTLNESRVVSCIAAEKSRRLRLERMPFMKGGMLTRTPSLRGGRTAESGVVLRPIVQNLLSRGGDHRSRRRSRGLWGVHNRRHGSPRGPGSHTGCRTHRAVHWLDHSCCVKQVLTVLAFSRNPGHWQVPAWVVSIRAFDGVGRGPGVATVSGEGPYGGGVRC